MGGNVGNDRAVPRFSARTRRAAALRLGCLRPVPENVAQSVRPAPVAFPLWPLPCALFLRLAGDGLPHPGTLCYIAPDFMRAPGVDFSGREHTPDPADTRGRRMDSG